LVHTDKAVGEYINAHYISVKINGDSLEGKQLRDMYKYPGYPTTILMTANGEEIDRIVGFSGNKDEYFQMLKDYTEGRGTLADYLKKLKSEPDAFEAHYAVLKKYEDRNDYPAMQQYARKILQLDPQNTQGKQTEMQYYLAFCDYKSSGGVAPLLSFIGKCREERWIEQAYNNVIRFYAKKQDQPNELATYEAALEKLPRSIDLMNGYAWYIFENKVTEKYARGIQAARQAVELEPEADYIWDTLGQLLFADGQVNEAIKAMQKAVEINPKEESYRENLVKYKTHLKVSR
jgi:tetratricopeptide (TPR) repeat protein